MISMGNMNEAQVQGWLLEVKMPEVVRNDLVACDGRDLEEIVTKWTSESKRMHSVYIYICI
jgi:hypothetical protein